MPDREQLRAWLTEAGLSVSDSDLDRLSATYSQVRRVLGEFVALEWSRYEAPALGFQPPDELVRWDDETP